MHLPIRALHCHRGLSVLAYVLTVDWALFCLQVLEALDEDWFIKPHMRQQAFASAQAAAAAAAVAAVAAAEQQQDTPSSSSSSSSRLPVQPPGSAFGLKPAMMNHGRIEQMACLDGTLLWFLAEMEAAPEPKQVVMKWALHPVIGPKLKGKSWLQRLDLQEPLLSVYNRIRALNYMSQV